MCGLNILNLLCKYSIIIIQENDKAVTFKTKLKLMAVNNIHNHIAQLCKFMKMKFFNFRVHKQGMK